jgi:hypothetical protein
MNMATPCKHYTVEQYNQHMGYVDKGDRMVNTYSISSHTWKWTRKKFFHHLDLTALNSYIPFQTKIFLIDIFVQSFLI